MDVSSRVFTVLTPNFFLMYIYRRILFGSTGMGWDVCQFWTEYSSYHAKFCAIYFFLPICLNLISQVFELASHDSWDFFFLYLVWFFEKPFCDESSVNTKCSISRRNNAAWFSTESHFSFFHFSLCLPLSLLQCSTDPFIKRQRQKMLWLFPSSLCQWMLLLTAQLTAADRSSTLLCIMEFYLPQQIKLVCSFLPANFHKILRFLIYQNWMKLARK